MINKLIVAFSLIVLSAQALSENSYYRERTIIGVGSFYEGDKSVLMFDISGAKD